MSGISARLVFAGVGAGYIHCSVASRCLAASLSPDLREGAEIVECEQRGTSPLELFEKIAVPAPDVVLFPVYIWNRDFVAAVCRLCRRIIPDTGIVLGGPQMCEPESEPELCSLADVVVTGEGEGVISDVVRGVLAGRRNGAPKRPEIVNAPPADLATAGLPYGLYSDSDISSRIVYAETARGCPFSCEYCSSSSSGGKIRYFPAERIFPEFLKLMDRGARHFKFLDRSFNCEGSHALAVLDFFLEHFRDGMTLHFEFVPSFPSPEWRKRLEAFPPRALHLEVGVQTWDSEVAARVGRPLDGPAIESCIRYLSCTAKAGVHADLIAGLPGETAESFARGFDRLAGLRPAELQAGILKLLPGTAMKRHIEPFKMKFSPDPPFEILETSDIPFAEMRKISRFASVWNMIGNRGRFNSVKGLLADSGRSVFATVSEAAEFLYARRGKVHSVSPKAVAEALRAVCSGPDELREMNSALEKDFRTWAHAGFPSRAANSDAASIPEEHDSGGWRSSQ